MSDEAALLQAIRNHPDEDTPRLMYADWLDEHGDRDRAEFIRCQIEVARLPLLDPRRPAVMHRAVKLLSDNVGKWVAPFAPADWNVPTESCFSEWWQPKWSLAIFPSIALGGVGWPKVKFERGFVERVQLMTRELPEYDQRFAGLLGPRFQVSLRPPVE